MLGYASSGLPGPAGNRESFVWLAEPGRAGAVDDLEAAARRAEPSMKTVAVFTHKRPEMTGGALRRVIELAREAGVEVHLPEDEVEKHGIEPQDGVVLGADPPADPDVGDRARRRRHDPGDAPPVRAPRRAGVRGELRHDRLPGDDRARRSSTRASGWR